MPTGTPLISVIVPVFQAAEFLDQCVASIVEQSYRRLEIILVDDGSLDTCPALCDSWQTRDARIKVLHQANGGLSCARNAGLRLATGDLIGFVDSDDWIEPEMYEKLVQTLWETGADLTVCRFQRENASSSTALSDKEKNSIQKVILSSEEALKKLLLWDAKALGTCVWNKLYRRNLLAGIEFSDKQIFEDIPWMAQVIGKVKSCVCLDAVLYHYRQREGSLSRGEKKAYYREQAVFDMLELRIQYVQRRYPSLAGLAIGQYQLFCCSNYLELKTKYANLDPDDEICRRIHQRACQWTWRNIPKAQKSVAAKCGTLLFYFWPKGFLLLEALLGRFL